MFSYSDGQSNLIQTFKTLSIFTMGKKIAHSHNPILRSAFTIDDHYDMLSIYVTDIVIK